MVITVAKKILPIDVGNLKELGIKGKENLL
jgi:hypothetical protein